MTTCVLLKFLTTTLMVKGDSTELEDFIRWIKEYRQYKTDDTSDCFILQTAFDFHGCSLKAKRMNLAVEIK